jgi:hypothetical protein
MRPCLAICRLTSSNNKHTRMQMINNFSSCIKSPDLSAVERTQVTSPGARMQNIVE